MRLRPALPASLWLVIILLGLGFAGAVASLLVQRQQSQQHKQTVAAALVRGDPKAGKSVFESRGCGACHSVTGSPVAVGGVGPSLDGIAARAFLAGDQPNDPQHMILWVQHPQAMEPGVGMPEMGLSEREARDVAAYLYTLS